MRRPVVTLDPAWSWQLLLWLFGSAMLAAATGPFTLGRWVLVAAATLVLQLKVKI